MIQLTTWYPPHVGGVESHVKRISEGLRGLGCEVRIFTFSKSHETNTKSFSFIRIPSIHECYSILPFPGLLSELLRSDADVIHAHAYGYPVAWAAAFVRRVHGTPFVYTTHSDPYGRIYPIFDAGRLLPLRPCDAVIAHTELEAIRLRKMGIDSAKIRLIPEGFPEVKAGGPPPIRDPYILCLGRVVFHQKGQDILLRAYQMSRFKHKLVFAGDGEDLPKLRQLAKGDPNIIFLGAVYGDQKWTWLDNADLVVMPSRTESYGQVAMEAMAMGKRLVVTKVGGLQHTAAHYAMMADPNPASLSKSIQAALQQESHPRLGSLRAPSWNTVTSEIFKVYRELMGQRN